MQKTAKLGLNKPDLTDYVNISDLNENMDVLDEAVGNAEDGLTTHLADYEYQIPSVVGTQIRLTKQSDTDRLFFKLDADLSGNITISTDGGATGKPLVEIDGSPVTQLEKGFVEVVADAAFFTLRSRGISGVDKRALIEIVNEAEANESVLKTQFKNAVNAVDTDGGINIPANATWAEILAQVPNIKTGKKWASGTATAISKTLTVTGLTFIPKIFLTKYISTNDAPLQNTAFVPKEYFGSNANLAISVGGTGTIVNPTITLIQNGFILKSTPDSGFSEGYLYSWIALE